MVGSTVKGNAPQLTDVPTIQFTRDNLLTFEINSYLTDPDTAFGDTHTYQLVQSPDFLKIDFNTGMLSGVPQQEDVGDGAYSVKVIDSQGLEIEKIFNFKVENVNDAPILNLSKILFFTKISI